MKKPTSKPQPMKVKLRRVARSVRSGFRRYPREILKSLKPSVPAHEHDDLPELIHEMYPHQLAAVWIGHAGVLAQIGNHSVLIDPVMSPRIGMQIGSRTIGLPRIKPSAVPTEALKGVDIILITHAHFDHLDRPTLVDLIDSSTTVVVPIGCRKLIPYGFKAVHELQQNAEFTLSDLHIRAMAPAHWGARRVVDRRRGFNSYIVEGEGQRVLFAGDTAHTEVFDTLEGIDLAVLGIGAYDPWEHMHATPEQAWNMFRKIGANYLLPVHHSTFELSEEPVGEPMDRLRAIAGCDYGEYVIEPIEGELVIINEGPHEESEDQDTESDSPPQSE
jgi:L-ascorbate metabolism protein UlaG (beta-lactamase superfamily)